MVTLGKPNIVDIKFSAYDAFL